MISWPCCPSEVPSCRPVSQGPSFCIHAGPFLTCPPAVALPPPQTSWPRSISSPSPQMHTLLRLFHTWFLLPGVILSLRLPAELTLICPGLDRMPPPPEAFLGSLGPLAFPLESLQSSLPNSPLWTLLRLRAEGTLSWCRTLKGDGCLCPWPAAHPQSTLVEGLKLNS